MRQKSIEYNTSPEALDRMYNNNPAKTEKAREKISKKSSEQAKKRVQDGTHPFLSGNMCRDNINSITKERMLSEKNPMKNPEIVAKVNAKTECPYCNKIGSKRALKLNHFEKCKEHPDFNINTSPLYENCIVCGTRAKKFVITRYHNEKCKKLAKL